jgi:hypothetical protein
MALERRGNRLYFYRSVRVGTRVYKDYAGGGQGALMAAQLEAALRAEKQVERGEHRRLTAKRTRHLAKLREWLKTVDGVIAGALAAAGWHRPKREWRRKRGATMTTLATTGTAADVLGSWDPVALAARAGALPKDVVDKAAKGDRAVVPAVDEFLAHPAATVLWGDLGRRLLIRWVRRYAGTDVLTERAVYRFASDLRARLAGPNPTALDLLLAERVVLGWVFVAWAEEQYGRTLDNLSVAHHEFHLKRIDLANRTLLAAAKALAKVQRRKLPDVMAVVTVAPPPAAR